ncbi:cytochrome p450 domain-containing protein [Phthorimaea operculella]|nr:cytochrome p450 domain-containing protein [Phthorimaea operculella]
MQSSRRIFVNLNAINQNFVRNVTSTSASVNVNDAELKSWEEIPAPPSLPFIGQLHHFLPGGSLSDIKTLADKLYKMYGPICRVSPGLGKPMIFLHDPEAVATVLRGENWSPIRPGFESIEYYRKHYNKTPEESKRPTGLITDHGDTWRTFRTTVNPVMLHKKIIQHYTTQLEEVATDMVARMRKIRDDNKLNENFDTEMNLWALESIGVVALGGRINCLSEDLPSDSPQKRLIQCVHDIFKIANELDFKPNLWKYFATRKFKRAMKLYEEQEKLATYFVQKARKEIESKPKVDDEEKGVLEKLLEIDERIAVIMASDMLFAGVDTAANTMTATFYLLATNQDKQDKLRQAIADGDQKYVKACYKESLRIMPVVAGNMRQTQKDFNILGYKIPKGSFVVFGHQYMSALEDQFPRPKEFIPERWIEGGPLSHKNSHPFTWMPFGFGVRMCIGRRIAELEIETFLKETIKNFKVEWSGPPPNIEPSALNYVKGPFNFTFKDV